MADQGITGRSRSDPSPISFQERRTKRRFHSGNAFAHRSESQVHALGALSEAALLRYGQEQPHIRQIEAQFLFLRFCRTNSSEMTNCDVWSASVHYYIGRHVCLFFTEKTRDWRAG